MIKAKSLALGATATVLVACLTAPALAADPPSKVDQQRGAELMQKQMSQMTPELVERAKALSPEIKQFLMHVALRHERRSDTSNGARVAGAHSSTPRPPTSLSG